MLLRIMILLGLVWIVACSDGSTTEEPVVAQGESSPAIPDLPGQAGESDPKPAGDTQADLTSDQSTGEKADATSEEQATSDTFYVSSYSLNVRSGPGMTHPVVDHLVRGAEIVALEQSGVWLKIGQDRYVSKNHVATSKAE